MHDDKLTGDPAYNVKLGAAHLGDLIDDFGGSYVLTLVAYNAGPEALARMGCRIWRPAQRAASIPSTGSNPSPSRKPGNMCRRCCRTSMSTARGWPPRRSGR